MSTVSIYPSSTVPAHPSDADASAVELGVRFAVNTPGTLTAIKYYKSAANSGTHITERIWNAL